MESEQEEEEEEIIDFYETLKNKIVNKFERKWILKQYSNFEELMEEKDLKKKKKLFKKFLKILMEESEKIDKKLVKIKDLKIENKFERNNGILFGKLKKREKTNTHLGKRSKKNLKFKMSR